MGNSPPHVDNVALVYNPFTGLVSPQYYLVFDHEISTLQSLRNGSIPSNLTKLCESQSYHAQHEDVTLDLLNTFLLVAHPEAGVTSERGEMNRIELRIMMKTLHQTL